MATEIDLGNVIGPTGPKGDTGDVGPRGDTGPKGDPGQDARLPAGGTAGQVLTKTADGEEWQDAPDGLPSGGSQGDVLAKTASGEEWSGGYLWVSDMDGNDWTLLGYFSGAERNVPHLTVKANGTTSSKIDLDATLQKLSISGSSPQVDVRTPFGEYVTIKAMLDNTAEIATNGKLTIGSKSVTSINDDASTGNTKALATAKAVKDYADSVGVPAGGTAGQVLTKTSDGEAWADANSSGISVVQAENKYGTRTLDKGMKLYGVVWIDDIDSTALSGLYTESTLETIISNNINIGVGGSTVDISDNGNEFVVRSRFATILDFYGIE